MKLISKTERTKTVELTSVELALLTGALYKYSQIAFEETGNHIHADAIQDAYVELVDIYCQE
jgi:hypothetical protein